jgi:hypothetical protein
MISDRLRNSSSCCCATQATSCLGHPRQRHDNHNIALPLRGRGTIIVIFLSPSGGEVR